MATATRRKMGSIHDYPEHLNPFHEEDNHNKIRFWTLGRRLSLSRSNSINFSGIKDLKNSWAFRSFMRKGKKGQQSSSHDKTESQVNGESSPVVFRRALQYSSASTAGQRSTVGSPERYVYGGSITPLPRSRFQERLRSCSQQEVGSISATPRMARSEVSGSRLSVESSNPFDEAPGPPGPPVPPVRASRRKKKRAPAPPHTGTGALDVSVTSETSDLDKSVTVKETETTDADLENIEEVNLNVELKIFEDEDVQVKNEVLKINDESPEIVEEKEIPPKENAENSLQSPELKEVEQETDKNVDSSESTIEYRVKNSSCEDILDSVSFPKIDIATYRRNSSVNDNDIRLRRGNLEDFHALNTKRSKSLNNTSDSSYVSYDINLNEDINLDKNCKEEPQKVICKLDETPRKQSLDNSVSSTEKEFQEIDKMRKEFEREIKKLNAALANDFSNFDKVSVTDIRRKFDNNNISSPNPIPKPRRSHYGGDSPSPVNGNIKT